MKKLVVLLAVSVALFTVQTGIATAGALEEIQKRGSLRVGVTPGVVKIPSITQHKSVPLFVSLF